MAKSNDSEAREGKKEYFPPKIVHTEVMQAVAVSCAMADENSCGTQGPIQS